jgi:cysteine-rich repeat protein
VAGFAKGSPGLACKADCTFDTTACKATCGNGAVEQGEECDDGVSPAAPGDGCSKYCQNEPAEGDLVITEVMLNPEFGATSGSTEFGEWFELHNTSPKPIDLRGLRLAGSIATETHLIDAPTPVVVAPKAYGLMALSGDMAKNGGIKPLYVYASIGFLNSNDDKLRIETAATPPVVIDAMTFKGGSTKFIGASYSLAPAALTSTANDVVTNWCPSKSLYGAGDKGTPGFANDPCP